MSTIDGFKGKSVDIDFAVGSILGTRSFLVARNGEVSGVAYSMFRYTPGENVATCVKNNTLARHPDHPMSDCEHGFWAYFNGKNEFSVPGTISGLIEGYGEVIIGDKGFRASKARIRAFVEPASTWRKHFGYEPSKLISTILTVIIFLMGITSTVMGLISGQISWLLALGFAIVFPVILYQELSYYLNYRTAKKAEDALNAGSDMGDLPSTAATESVKEDYRTRLKFQQVRQRYPDIPVFGSYRELLNAYPQLLEQKKTWGKSA